MGLMAASTHPFADWGAQITTAKDRYAKIEADCRTVAQRLLICGMHVHVGVPDEDLRIDLHGQLIYFLPHLLALSDLVAVLARTRHRPEILSHGDIGRAAARRPAADLLERRRIPAASSISW